MSVPDVIYSRELAVVCRVYLDEMYLGRMTDDRTFYCRVGIEGNDTLVYKVYNDHHIRLYDSAMIDKVVRKVKQLPEYDSVVSSLRYSRYRKIMSPTWDFIFQIKNTPSVPSREFIEERLSSLSVDEYIPLSFQESEPTHESVRTSLELEAVGTINPIMFKEKKRSKYVDENLEQRYKKLHDKWELSKSMFEAKEAIRKESYLRRQKEKKYFEYLLSEDYSTVAVLARNAAEEFMKQTDLIADVSCSPDSNTVYASMSLPAIDDLPKSTAKYNAKGAVSLKQKSSLDLNMEYISGCTGVSFVLAGYLFRSSLSIDNVQVSAYTQRRDNQTGNIKDTYLYSVKFDRARFVTVDHRNCPIYRTFCTFPHKIDISGIGQMKEIEPLPVPKSIIED